MIDPKTEHFLDRGQWNWEYVAFVDFKQIDLKASDENPARLNRRIDTDRVIQYGCEMLDGVEFPAIVLLRQDGADHIVATGMHRLRAAQEAKRHGLDAYLVTESDQFRCEVLTRQLNGIEGVGEPIRQQILHVLYLHEHFPKHSLTELAKSFGLKPDAVLRTAAEQSGLRRAQQFGFDFESPRGRQPQGTIIALNTIPTDHVYMKAAQFVAHHGPGVRDVEELVKEMKRVRNGGDLAEIEVIVRAEEAAEKKKQRAKAAHGRTPPTHGNRLVGRCKMVNNQIRDGIEQLHLSALADPSGAIVVFEDLIDGLKSVIGAIERIMRLNAKAPTAPAAHVGATI